MAVPRTRGERKSSNAAFIAAFIGHSSSIRIDLAAMQGHLTMLRVATWRESFVNTLPLLIGSDIYRTSCHGSGHPLAIPRVSLAIDLCRALGWLPDSVYRDSPQASAQDIMRYHREDYVAAVIDAERNQSVSATVAREFNLGINGNTIHPDMFRRPATACGASLLAARLIAQGQRRIVYSPAGGTHHGQPGRASGFCTFNDPVLGILALLDAGMRRVFYLDLDAHFGDGVQLAFHDDDRVFTLSLHESGRWPMIRSGGAMAPGGVLDRALGAARNLPIPPPSNDSEIEFLVDTVVLPLIDAFDPEVLVVQCGADALAEDPMTRLTLSNLAIWRTVAAVKPLAPSLLVLGGGGYNPYSVSRCWAGLWAILNGLEIPRHLPPAARDLMSGVVWHHRRAREAPNTWFTTLADAPRDGPVRPEIRALAKAALAP
jgi:acetoin utilization protein AcuC